MVEFVVGLAVGLVVGWNFIPQPTTLKLAIERLVTKIKSLRK